MGQQPPEYQPYQQPDQQPYGQQPDQQPYGQQPYDQPYGQQPAPYGYQPQVPFGVDPATGIAYSDKSKIVAGLLQILLPLGIGRMYTGHVGIGVAQLLVTLFTCGLGSLWPFIDGILILVGTPRDSQGRPLKS